MILPDIDQVRKLLHKGEKISIIPHKNPDGDAIGSALALKYFLKMKNIDAQVISPNTLPKFLLWLPGVQNIVIFDENPQEAKQFIEQSQVIFTLDFNALHRADTLSLYLENSSADFIMIDHHQNPDTYARVTYSDVNASSTCEMMYRFFTFLQEQETITPQIATCLYTGMMTDTGCFCYPNTTDETLRIASVLKKKGADNSQIYNNIYNSRSFNSLKLLAKTLSEYKYLEPYHTAYTILTCEDLENYSFEKGDTEGFVNYGLSIQGVKLSVILIEQKKENTVRLSFRSKGDIDVNHMARTYFNGGGHVNASGGVFIGSIHNAEAFLLEVLAKFFS